MSHATSRHWLRRIAGALSPALLLCCSPRAAQVPGNALLDRVEQALERNPCVGALSRWARHYRFGGTGRHVDENVVTFELREAGKYDFRSGRYALPPQGERVFDVDSRDYLMAAGHYAVQEGRMSIDYCGPTNDPRFEVNAQALPPAPSE